MIFLKFCPIIGSAKVEIFSGSAKSFFIFVNYMLEIPVAMAKSIIFVMVRIIM